MAILVYAEHDNKELKKATLNTIAAASKMGGDIVVLVAGSGCEAVAAQAAKAAGVAKVLCASNPAYEYQLAENVADLVVSMAGDYSHIIAPATTNGKNFMPRVAALLDVNMVSEISAVIDGETFERPIYAGNAIATVKDTESKKIITVRTTAFDAVAAEGGSATVETLSAAMGASRAAVDAGYVANDLQVGQTGKIVAPNLYIAVGISGAIQHLAGMKDSKVIVAINNDPEAPIVQVADYFLEGDIFQILPELTAKL